MREDSEVALVVLGWDEVGVQEQVLYLEFQFQVGLVLKGAYWQLQESSVPVFLYVWHIGTLPIDIAKLDIILQDIGLAVQLATQFILKSILELVEVLLRDIYIGHLSLDL